MYRESRMKCTAADGSDCALWLLQADAVAYCSAHYAGIASVHSHAENGHAATACQQYADPSGDDGTTMGCWIGLTDESRTVYGGGTAAAGGSGGFTVRARLGRLSALSASYSKSFLYGALIWARRALNSAKRWSPARAVGGRLGGGLRQLGARRAERLQRRDPRGRGARGAGSSVSCVHIIPVVTRITNGMICTQELDLQRGQPIYPSRYIDIVDIPESISQRRRSRPPLSGRAPLLHAVRLERPLERRGRLGGLQRLLRGLEPVGPAG
jgi:hypothetical protein